MEKIFKNAIFEYDKEDEDLIIELNEYIDEHVDEIYNFFGNDIEREIPYIKIIRTKEELDKICRKYNKLDDNESIAKWLIGFANDDGIFYLSIKDYKSTTYTFDSDDYLEEYKKTIIHEYIHFINYLFNKKYNCFLSLDYLVEGIAQVLSNQNDNVKLKFIYSLDDILNSNDCYNGWFLVMM